MTAPRGVVQQLLWTFLRRKVVTQSVHGSPTNASGQVRCHSTPGRMPSWDVQDVSTPAQTASVRLAEADHKLTFWSVLGLNVGVMLISKDPSDAIRQFYLDHLRCSIESLSQRRFHTVFSSTWAHLSAVHLALNVFPLYVFRTVQPLRPAELLGLYIVGSLMGVAAHLGYMWYDARGDKYGLQYAINSPPFMGASAGVSAILAYKTFMDPMAVRLAVIVPVPIAFALMLFVVLEVKEKEYFDFYAPRLGGVALGLIAATLATATRRRVPVWMRS